MVNRPDQRAASWKSRWAFCLYRAPRPVQQGVVFLRQCIRRLFGAVDAPREAFLSDYNVQHTRRRLEHLDSLNLDLEGKSVLEVGAGIGNLTGFFLERGCRVVSTDARPENIEMLQKRYPNLETQQLDLDGRAETPGEFEVIFCYGLLYHLGRPAEAIAAMAGWCRELLLIETSVSYERDSSLHLYVESREDPRESVYGTACRPTRRWVYEELRKNFGFVYIPVTQPRHEDFPTDWLNPPFEHHVPRAIFVASHSRLQNPLLVEALPDRQGRH